MQPKQTICEPPPVVEKKKVSQLEGNLALKFLMNPKELTQLVSSNIKDKKRKNSDDEKKKPQHPDQSISQSQAVIMSQIPKNKKFKYPIKSINEFIQKMLKKEVSTILNKVLPQDDVEWAGVKKCFNTFYDKIQERLMEDELLS
jgi:hypothetical protein